MIDFLKWDIFLNKINIYNEDITDFYCSYEDYLNLLSTNKNITLKQFNDNEMQIGDIIFFKKKKCLTFLLELNENSDWDNTLNYNIDDLVSKIEENIKYCCFSIKQINGYKIILPIKTNNNRIEINNKQYYRISFYCKLITEYKLQETMRKYCNKLDYEIFTANKQEACNIFYSDYEIEINEPGFLCYSINEETIKTYKELLRKLLITSKLQLSKVNSSKLNSYNLLISVTNSNVFHENIHIKRLRYHIDNDVLEEPLIYCRPKLCFFAKDSFNHKLFTEDLLSICKKLNGNNYFDYIEDLKLTINCNTIIDLEHDKIDYCHYYNFTSLSYNSYIVQILFNLNLSIGFPEAIYSFHKKDFFYLCCLTNILNHKYFPKKENTTLISEFKQYLYTLCGKLEDNLLLFKTEYLLNMLYFLRSITSEKKIIKEDCEKINVTTINKSLVKIVDFDIYKHLTSNDKYYSKYKLKEVKENPNFTLSTHFTLVNKQEDQHEKQCFFTDECVLTLLSKFSNNYLLYDYYTAISKSTEIDVEEMNKFNIINFLLFDATILNILRFWFKDCLNDHQLFISKIVYNFCYGFKVFKKINMEDRPHLQGLSIVGGSSNAFKTFLFTLYKNSLSDGDYSPVIADPLEGDFYCQFLQPILLIEEFKPLQAKNINKLKGLCSNAFVHSQLKGKNATKLTTPYAMLGTTNSFYVIDNYYLKTLDTVNFNAVIKRIKSFTFIRKTNVELIEFLDLNKIFKENSISDYEKATITGYFRYFFKNQIVGDLNKKILQKLPEVEEQSHKLFGSIYDDSLFLRFDDKDNFLRIMLYCTYFENYKELYEAKTILSFFENNSIFEHFELFNERVVERMFGYKNFADNNEFLAIKTRIPSLFLMYYCGLVPDHYYPIFLPEAYLITAYKTSNDELIYDVLFKLEYFIVANKGEFNGQILHAYYEINDENNTSLQYLRFTLQPNLKTKYEEEQELESIPVENTDKYLRLIANYCLNKIDLNTLYEQNPDHKFFIRNQIRTSNDIYDNVLGNGFKGQLSKELIIFIIESQIFPSFFTGFSLYDYTKLEKYFKTNVNEFIHPYYDFNKINKEPKNIYTSICDNNLVNYYTLHIGENELYKLTDEGNYEPIHGLSNHSIIRILGISKKFNEKSNYIEYIKKIFFNDTHELISANKNFNGIYVYSGRSYKITENESILFPEENDISNNTNKNKRNNEDNEDDEIIKVTFNPLNKKTKHFY